MKKLFALLYLALMAVSCSNEDLLATEEANDASTNIKFSIKDFELVTDEPETRTVIENSVKNKVKARWCDEDLIGLFGITDFHVPQTVIPISKASQKKDDEEGSMSLTFNGNGVFNLNKGQKYIAYYPYQDMMSSKSYDKIPISFEGQEQTVNDDGSHLGKYDFLCSDVTVANSGVTNFVFNHAICVAKFKIKLTNVKGIYRNSYNINDINDINIEKVTIKNMDGEKIFVEKGFVNANTNTIIPTVKSEKISINLINVKPFNYGENREWYIYIAFAPTTLKNCRIIVTTNHGSTFQSKEVIGERQMKAGQFFYSDVFTKWDKYNQRTTDEIIDLGLPSGTKWSVCNLGAKNDYECGNYYMWGMRWETKVLESHATNYRLALRTDKNGNYAVDPYDSTWDGKWRDPGYPKYIKYCSKASLGNNGFVDNKNTLDDDDDVTKSIWGKSWSIPTHTQQMELLRNCRAEWTNDYKQTGIAGMIYTSNINGNSIFFPAAGYLYQGKVENKNYRGYYCSNQKLATDDHVVYMIFIGKKKNTTEIEYNSTNHTQYRDVACPIRPVLNP